MNMLPCYAAAFCIGVFMEKKTAFSELVIGLLIAALGIFAFCYGFTLKTAKTGIGAGGYPKFIGAVLFILGACQIGVSLFHGVRKPEFRADRKKIVRLAGLVGAMVLYLWLLPHLGFVIMTPILLIALMLLFGIRRRVLGIIVAIVFTIIVYLLFTQVFMVFLPRFTLF